MNTVCGRGDIDGVGEGEAPSLELARALLAGLVAHGVREFVHCPGSRCAPLAHALAEVEEAGLARVHVRLDERSAAFLALGLSRAGELDTDTDTGADAGADADGAGARQVPGRTGSPDLEGLLAAHAHRTPGGARPVALIGTSGGAIAEFHAGVAEASHTGVPLVVLSADRPFEMRGVGASQTTDQVGIFGPHVRAHWDVPAGTSVGSSLTALTGRAVAAACGAPAGRPGPVQVNVGFRDPLVPSTHVDVAGWRSLVRDLLTRTGSGLVRVRHARPTPVAWEEVVDPELATLVLAGDGAPREAAAWAEAAGVPLLAEPNSRLAESTAWVPHEQSLLVSDLADRVEQVVLAGRPTLSRPVSALLAREGLRLVVVAPGEQWPDVAGRASEVVPALAPARSPHVGAGSSAEGWAREWRDRAARVDDWLEGRAGRLDHVGVARTVWRHARGTLLLGASNAIRAVDLAADAPGRRAVLANRGLAGIDGTIATARGLALVLGEVTALMGDLTFLHDAGALARTRGEEVAPVRIVLVDDSGGSIFASLEHGERSRPGVFDRFFGTAQEVDVAHLCAAHGVAHVEVGSVAELAARLGEPVRGMEVVHVRVPVDPAALRDVRDCARTPIRSQETYSRDSVDGDGARPH